MTLTLVPVFGTGAQSPAAATPGDSLPITATFSGGQSVDSDAAIGLMLSRPIEARDGRIAVLVGSMDVTGLLERHGTEMIYRPRGPLPAGDIRGLRKAGGRCLTMKSRFQRG